MTHMKYPYIEDYTDLFEDIYAELGFKTTLIPTPHLRGLILLNQGVVDADVFRLANTAKNYPNIIIVQPALTRANVTLFCRKDVPCNRDILTDKSITMLVSEPTIKLLGPEEFQARQSSHSSISNIPDMLKANRYAYALFLLDDLMVSQYENEFQLVSIKSVMVHHVIHKKHLALLPLIEEKIRAKLPEVLRNRAARAKR